MVRHTLWVTDSIIREATLMTSLGGGSLRIALKKQDPKRSWQKWTTPKMYTRTVYSQNNDVLTASLYNDRRIYHEVLKLPKQYLIEVRDGYSYTEEDPQR